MVEARPESKEVVELRQPPEEAVEPVVEEPLPEPGLDRPGDCTSMPWSSSDVWCW